MENKLDLILKEQQNFGKKLEHLENQISNLETKNINLENKIINLEANNNEEHQKMLEILTSLNSAFIRYEAEELDKIRILFDSDLDRKDHQKIYSHEFTKINHLIAKNSFRISNLENHFKKD